MNLNPAFERWVAGETFTGLDTPIPFGVKLLMQRAFEAGWQARAALKDTGWISVKDRLPKVGELAWVVIGGIVQFSAARFGGTCWEWVAVDADSAPRDIVTHWRPLPAPPEDGKA